MILIMTEIIIIIIVVLVFMLLLSNTDLCHCYCFSTIEFTSLNHIWNPFFLQVSFLIFASTFMKFLFLVLLSSPLLLLSSHLYWSFGFACGIKTPPPPSANSLRKNAIHLSFILFFHRQSFSLEVFHLNRTPNSNVDFPSLFSCTNLPRFSSKVISSRSIPWWAW